MQPWIAGRQSAACGLLGDGTLVTLGGYGPGRVAPNNTLASFTWTQGNAVSLHASIAKQSAPQFTFQWSTISSVPLLKPMILESQSPNFTGVLFCDQQSSLGD